MKFLWLLIGLLSLQLALAEELVSQVEAIDLGEEGRPHLIKLSNGRTVFLDDEDRGETKSFQQCLVNKCLLRIVVDDKFSFISAETLNSRVFENSKLPVRESRDLASFEPTLLPNMLAANNIFQKMRRDYQNNSQCYNRAHIWAYEEFNRSALKSIKLFMFFTNRYIRNYRYHWWFHVTPMVLVEENNSSIEMTLDRRYTRSPLSIKDWTDVFIYSRRDCPVVQKYSDYENHQEAEDCYLIPVSMYFWQPRDIHNRDQTGRIKTDFIRSEVNWAYREAF